MITMGLDLGSVATKGIILDGSKQYRALLPTGWSPRDTGEKIIEELLALSGLELSRIDMILATGYGRVSLKLCKTITEVSCHARGVAELFPLEGTVIDIGGQDSKVMHIDERGKVLEFAMNDKCAAGTGRFLQVMATALGMDVGELGGAEDPSSQVTINSMCTVFAESEIIGLLAQGTNKGGIIAGLHQAVGKRVAIMCRRMGIKNKVILTGGVAMNSGVQRALSEELGCSLTIPKQSQFTGALGAALLARES